MLVTPQRELQPATIREMPEDSPNNGELAPLYRVNDSGPQQGGLPQTPDGCIPSRPATPPASYPAPLFL
jgi:hypothetical protein